MPTALNGVNGDGIRKSAKNTARQFPPPPPPTMLFLSNRALISPLARLHLPFRFRKLQYTKYIITYKRAHTHTRVNELEFSLKKSKLNVSGTNLIRNFALFNLF